VKLPLGLWDNSTENATLARELLSDLVERGLDPEQTILFVIDGPKASGAPSTMCSASTRSCIGVTGTRRATSVTSFLRGRAAWVPDQNYVERLFKM
jgi:hypothetical protein